MLSALILALAIADATAQPSPATIVGETYYLVSELDELDHHFDPDHWVDGQPQQITFEAPGKLTLEYAQEEDHCTFTATGKGASYKLALTCEGKSIAKARWVWLGPGRARTSLLSEARKPEVLREVIVPGQPVDLKALDAHFDEAYAAAQLPKLVGAYQDGKGIKLTVAADGSATLAGEPIKVVVKRCSAEPPLPTTAPCLLRQPPEGEAQVGSTVFLAVEREGRVVLEEGLLGSDVDYCPFEAVPRARKFERAVDDKATHSSR
jgi:hypothetical protein